jgi:DNA-binding transcriptional MocR family regulator
MTIDWMRILGSGGRSAREIADALDLAIASGELPPGERLPTHRALARLLGVSVGTITRAYALAAERHRISGEVGRGTFVRAPEVGSTERSRLLDLPAADVDLGLNLPSFLPATDEPAVADVLARLEPQGVARLLGTPWGAVEARQREIGLRWFARAGLIGLESERVLFATGFHTALQGTLRALTRPGDAVLCEARTYPGLKRIASSLHLRLVGAEVDREGLRPEALARAVRTSGARVVHLRPTFSTVTGATVPPARRRELAELARARDLVLVEEDEMFPLLDEPLVPLAALAPERTVLIADVTRATLVGLRLAFVLAPSTRRPELEDALHHEVWMPSPLLAELLAQWTDDGALERLLAARRADLDERSALAREVLGNHDLHCPPRSTCAWLTLPDGRRADRFALAARARGVELFPADLFHVPGGPSAPSAVRLSLTGPETVPDLERGLRIVGELLSAAPSDHRPLS